MHIVCITSENCEIGIYAPMINPETADNKPKNAPLALTDLRNSTIIMKIEVAEIEPNATTPNAFRISIPPKYISPCIQMVTKPTARIIPVRITEEKAADTK